MKYLDLAAVLRIHALQIDFAGGDPTVLDIGKVESAVAQPRMSFGGELLYPTLPDQAAALGFSLIKNHPFLDANKRTGQAAMEAFLYLNGFELVATVDEQHALILGVASGMVGREAFTEWIRGHLAPAKGTQAEEVEP